MSDIRTAGAEATGAALEMLLCGAEQRVFDDSRWAMLIEGRMALCHSGRCCNDEFGDCVRAGELHPGRLSEKKPLNSQPGPAAAGADCGWEEDVSGGVPRKSRPVSAKTTCAPSRVSTQFDK
jgi:hypothetical protein